MAIGVYYYQRGGHKSRNTPSKSAELKDVGGDVEVDDDDDDVPPTPE